MESPVYAWCLRCPASPTPFLLFLFPLLVVRQPQPTLLFSLLLPLVPPLDALCSLLLTIFIGALRAISVICARFDGDHACRGISEFGNYSTFNMQILLGAFQTRPYYHIISTSHKQKKDKPRAVQSVIIRKGISVTKSECVDCRITSRSLSANEPLQQRLPFAIGSHPVSALRIPF